MNYLNRRNPVSEIFVGLFGSNVVHANNAVSLAKILLGDASVALLTGRVPERQRNNAVFDHYRLDLKVDTFFSNDSIHV